MAGARKGYVALARRAEWFLAALADSGNATMAAQAAGVGRGRIYARRRDDAAFARGWAEALARFEAGQRDELALDGAGGAEAAGSKAADSIWEKVTVADGLVLRRGRRGAMQLAAARPRDWSGKIQAAFLDHYVASGNVALAARAAGVARGTVWRRRRTDPDFAAAWDALKQETYDRMELMLIERASAQIAGPEGAEGGDAGEAGAAGAGQAAAFDPQLAMWLLKRRDAELGGTLRRGRGAMRPPRIEDVTAKILRKVEAIERHRARMAQGWMPGGAAGGGEAGGGEAGGGEGDGSG
jgi:hypothetical protein